MQKTYRIDSSLGQITSKLEDKIQSNSGISLRERSFEELTNFIPRDDYLLETINGVSLEYLIENALCKTFNVRTNSRDTIFHIFSDKIITAIPNLKKIFIDIIPEDIACEVLSISTCFKISDNVEQKLIFNSIAGVYFCSIIPINPNIVENGKPYFSKIEIPKSLKGEEIQSKTANMFLCVVAKNLDGRASAIDYSQTNITDPSIGIKPPVIPYIRNADPYLQSKPIDKDISSFYLEGNSFGIGDIVQFNISYSSGVFVLIPNTKTIIGEVVQNKIEGLSFTRNGRKLVYPKSVLPPNITTCSVPPLKGIPSISCDWFNITEPTTPITLYKVSSNDLAIIPSIAGGGSTGDLNYWAPYHLRSGRNFQGRSPETAYFFTSDVMCITNLNINVKIIKSGLSNVSKLYPYTPYSLAGRLVVSFKDQMKFSKTGDYTNFSIPTGTPTETDAFTRTLQDVDEITFISKWGQLGVQEGFVVGTTTEIIFFSSIANIFTTNILSRRNIPCSYIQPIDILYQGLPATLIVEAGRTKITAVIFTRDQTAEITLTDNVDFFETDPIKRIQSIKYRTDQMVFALTDSNKLYACLTGGAKLNWFKINFSYPLQDISAFDNGLIKKLFLVSGLSNNSTYQLVGSINFSEGERQIKAEYFTDLTLDDDNIFDSESPVINGTSNYKFIAELTEEQKTKLPKPIIAKAILHNQEIINKNYNTKASRAKRKISNVNINVKNSNYFTIKYICQDGNGNPITKTAYDIQRNDDNLNPKRVKELIKIFQASPAMDSIKLLIETDKNSIVPLTIQSISFDTEYVNIK